MSAAVQLPLLGRARPSIDLALRGVTRVPLTEGAWVDRLPGWVQGHSTLFDELLSRLEWHTAEQAMYDQVVATPRLLATADLETPPVPLLATIADVLSVRYATRFDSAHLAWYRDGRDSVAWHTDRDGRDRSESLTAIVSLGEPRRFLLRPKKKGRSVRFTAGWGDLLIMGGSCQRTWEHSVPKARSAGPRISVMFRHSAPVGSLRASGDSRDPAPSPG
jgi:alkylated DNA repair dioxygenase AlkB